MKLRMLNSSHSALAYVALLAGYTTVHEAMADPAIRGFVARCVEQTTQLTTQPTTPPTPTRTGPISAPRPRNDPIPTPLLTRRVAFTRRVPETKPSTALTP